jgi:hypothetical protein
MQVSTFLDEAYEDCNCSDEVGFSVVTKVPNWNKERRFILCKINVNV